MVLRLGRSLGERDGNPLQYSYLESPMDGEAWWAIVHGVAKSLTRLKRLSTHALTHLVLETTLTGITIIIPILELKGQR